MNEVYLRDCVDWYCEGKWTVGVVVSVFRQSLNLIILVRGETPEERESVGHYFSSFSHSTQCKAERYRFFLYFSKKTFKTSPKKERSASKSNVTKKCEIN